MTGTIKKEKKGWKAALSFILALLLVLSPFSMPWQTAEASDVLVLDIGVNVDSVKAEFTPETGALKITGVGEVRNYTPATAPFAQWDVCSVEIGGGVSTLGAYLFYNCGGLSGELVLPDGLFAIGEGAFSGENGEKAPKFTLIQNDFTQCMVTRKRESAEEEKTREPELSSEMEKTGEQEKPPSEDNGGESAASVVSPSPEQGGSQSAQLQEEKTEGISTQESEPQTKNASGEETQSGQEEEGQSAQVVSQAESGAPEASQVPSPKAEEEPASSSSQSEDGENSSSPQQQEDQVSSGEAVSPSPEPAASMSPEPSSSPEGNYTIETLTQQELGKDVFFPGSGEQGYFICQDQNQTFQTAAEQAGYTRAERMISAAFDCGDGQGGTVVKELPVAKGVLRLPELLPEITPPEESALFSYSFRGWIESQDEADQVRETGSFFEIGSREDLYFIAAWNKQVQVKLSMKVEDGVMILSVPQVEGYDITAYCWQWAQLSKGDSLENQKDLVWEDIPEETGAQYRRTLEPGDENRAFRCVLTVKQQGFFAFFSASNGEEVVLEAVNGAQAYAASGTYQISFAKGSYNSTAASGADMAPVTVEQGEYTVIPSCSYTAPTASGSTIVFNGWKDDSGTLYDPGQIVTLTGNLTLTAQWGAATVIYVGSGKSLDNGMNELPAGGTKYTNILVVTGNLSSSATLNKNMTITNIGPDKTYTGTLNLSGYRYMGADVRFQDIAISVSNDTNIFAMGHSLQFGDGVTITPEYKLTVYGGGDSEGVTTNTRVLASSGSFLAVYGGSLRADITGSTSVQLSGTAETGGLFGGGWYGGSVVSGNTEILVAGNAQAAAIAGGNRASDSSAGVDGSSHVVVAGNARVEDTNDIKTTFEFQSIGFVGGSGCDASNNSEPSGNVRGGTLVEIRENAYVSGGVFGGSGDGWAQDPDAKHPDWMGTKGGTNVLISGNPTINGGVFGGGNKRACEGLSSVTIEGGTISGGVFGGGSNAHNSGSSSSSTINISGGTISGGVFGGGDKGNLDGGSAITITGGAINGYVYGGGNQGDVGGTSQITVSGASAKGIYLGGLSGAVNTAGSGVSILSVTDAQVEGSVYGGGDQGVLGGTVEMTVAGETTTVGGSLYLGGKSGNVTGTGESVLTLSGGAVSGSVYGGGFAGDMSGSSAVLLSGGAVTGSMVDGALSGGSVYGGGQQGAVGGDSRVEISGGVISGSVYGGGQEGAVGGNSSAFLSGGEVKGCLYGGSKGVSAADSATGTVSGSSYAEVTGGSLGGVDSDGVHQAGTGSVFGGGEFAATTGLSSVKIDGGSTGVVFGSVYGGGSEAPSGSASVTVHSGEIRGSVFGAGFGTASSTGAASVTVEGGTVLNSVYGGGEKGSASGGTQVMISGGAISQDAFGGGCGDKAGADQTAGRVLGLASLTMTGGSVHNLYGGGDYGPVGSGTLSGTGKDLTVTAADGASSTKVALSGGTVMGSLFGGGSGSGGEDAFGAVFGPTVVTVSGGTVSGGVYGGSNRSYVSGSTSVTVKASAGDISIGDTVFGGGNLPGGENAQFQEIYLVQGGSQVEVDGGGSHGLTIGGSVYGSGNLTLVKGGTKNVTIRNFNGSLLSVQRADVADIIACNLYLVGAVDVTEAVTRYYSLSQIGNLRLADQTLLRVDREARDLEAMGNYVTQGTGLTVSREEATRSTLQVYQGKKLQIRNMSGVYGLVSGVLWLDVVPEAGAQSSETGISIQASADSAVGDGETDTGAFVKANTEASASLPLISGLIEGSHTYWRLGSAVSTMDLTLQAVHADNGGTGLVEETVSISSSMKNCQVVVSERKQTGSFYLMKPTEGADGSMSALPELTGSQTANNTFALRMEPTDSLGTGAWADMGSGAYVLTDDAAGNGDTPGIWNRGGSNPTTTGSGEEAELTFRLLYDPNFKKFAGGTVELTLNEYPVGAALVEENLESTTVLTITLESDGGGGVSREAYGAAGRKFGEVTGETPVSITDSGALTASFITQYLPSSTGAENMHLSLYKHDTTGGEEWQPTGIPQETKVVLADYSQPGAYHYYMHRSTGEPSMTLSSFASMGGSGSSIYPGPLDNTREITEKLLFAVDFSEATSKLSPGDYALRLTHSAAETVMQSVRFSISEAQTYSLDVSISSGVVWTSKNITITPTIPAGDTRFADGSLVKLRLTDISGNELGFPGKTKFTGTTDLLRSSDGSVSFSIEPGGAASFTLDFSEVPTEMLPNGAYGLKAELRPRTGLQIGTDRGAADAINQDTTFTLEGSTVPQRALEVQKDSGSRIMDVSAADSTLAFTLDVEMQNGDTLQAKIYRKEKEAPTMDSYALMTSTTGWCSVTRPSGGKATALVTVPRGTPAGTYRILFQILDSSGGSTVQVPYNFIVKETQTE